MSTWQKDVGSIHFVDNQCCWIAPSELLRDINSNVTSPQFFFEGMKWRIEKRHDWLYLWNEDSNPLKESYVATFSVEHISGWKEGFIDGQIPLHYGCGTEFLTYNRFADIKESYGCVKIYCKLEKKNINLPNKHPFSNETTHVGESSSQSKEEKEPKMNVNGLERLAQNLKKVLDDGQSSDVTLKAEDREFRVHRVILGARSPVFASMFQLEMKEKTSGVVDIPDCTAESFEVFLLYLYTGAAETMSSENVSNLYYAADKYRVDDLKEECVQFMKDNMSVENVCDVVALSLRHGERGLLKEATNFFRENVKKIIKTVQWQRYLQENNTHANELLVKALDD